MEELSWNLNEDENSVVFELHGYFNAETGQKLDAPVSDILAIGAKKVILDFTHCTTVNSPGVSVLMDLAIKASDDYRRRLMLCGLNQLKRNFFNMVGLFELADQAKDVTEARQSVMGKQGK